MQVKGFYLGYTQRFGNCFAATQLSVTLEAVFLGRRAGMLCLDQGPTKQGSMTVDICTERAWPGKQAIGAEGFFGDVDFLWSKHCQVW